MGYIVTAAVALGVGGCIGYGFGRIITDERVYQAGWHDCLDRLCHPAERRRRPLPPRPLPDARRRVERGIGTADAALLGLTLAAVIIFGSMVFGGPS